MDNQSEKPTAPHQRRGAVAWNLSAAVLALAVIGLAWHVYPRLQQQGAAIDALRSARSTAGQTQVQPVPKPANNPDVAAAEQQMHDQATQAERGLRASFAARVADVQRQAHQASEDAFQRAQALVDMQVRLLETRLGRLESWNTNQDRRVVDLQSEVGQIHQQLAQQATELQSVRQQINATASTETRQIAALKTSEERDSQDVDSVEHSLAMQRLDFEVTRNHLTELAPGIYLRIAHANPSFSNVDGWMRVMPQDRTFWLHHQDVHEPVIFYGSNDKKECELVLTAMRGDSIKGYLLLPEQPQAQIASARRGLR